MTCRPEPTQRYLLNGREIDLDEWSKAETAKMPPLTESQKALLRALFDVAVPSEPRAPVVRRESP